MIRTDAVSVSAGVVLETMKVSSPVRVGRDCCGTCSVGAAIDAVVGISEESLATDAVATSLATRSARGTAASSADTVSASESVVRQASSPVGVSAVSTGMGAVSATEGDAAGVSKVVELAAAVFSLSEVGCGDFSVRTGVAVEGGREGCSEDVSADGGVEVFVTEVSAAVETAEVVAAAVLEAAAELDVADGDWSAVEGR